MNPGNGIGIHGLLRNVAVSIASRVAGTSRHLEFLRYLLSSLTALCVDFLLLTSLVALLGLHYQLAAASGYFVGLLVNYAICRHWVFPQSAPASNWRGFLLFSVAGCGGTAMNASVMWLLVDLCLLDYRWSKLLAAGISFVVNFVLRRTFANTAKKQELAIS